MEININCDLGEKSKHHSNKYDPDLLNLVNSANVACGFHAGDDESMNQVVEISKRNGVSIGAHPSFNDPENFGRKRMNLSSSEIRKLIIDQYEIPIDELIDRLERSVKLWNDLEKDMTSIYDQTLKRSNEYASYIMDAISNNNEVTINANVKNNNLIDNLPDDCCVEVPCVINSDGCKPQKIGRLPEHLAALMRTNINVQLLTAEAAITKKREHIYHAAMLDPLTAANLSIDEIYSCLLYTSPSPRDQRGSRVASCG